MPSNHQQFYRPDGTPYEPNDFNVRQYEDQYGPGGVPEGWSMAATTPVQSPAMMVGIGVFVSLISLMMLVVGFIFLGSLEAKSLFLAFGVGIGGLAVSAYVFRLAAKRSRWLKENSGQSQE